MSPHKTAVDGFFRALGSGDSAAMSSLISEDVVATAHGSSLMSGQRNYSEVLEALTMLSQVTKEGIEFEILSMTEEENRVSCEAVGTSVLVTGQGYNNRYHFLFRFSGGQISTIDEYFDTKLVDELFGPIVQESAN